MNMKPLFLGVILAASYAHAASTEVSAKPVTGTAASAEVKTTAVADVTASQEASGKTLTAAQPTATGTDSPVKTHSEKKVMHKKAVAEGKENAATEKTGKEKTAEHKITAEKKKNTVDKQEEQKATAPTTATKTE
ncbi:hypothetical protein BM451_13285 [Dickeya dadantii]|uniref:hypothetical protein n=1 Tax=Dickeya dadantii TaxID=204038 RepID=UPI0009825E24|nr:hypothetical protein [Dickeya dadantii]OOC13006.1 hypothetical protein BM451_13285 [Dickeya dadantii]UAY97811.1 hypothetical protein KTF62_08075 [Dickeya dadantii]